MLVIVCNNELHQYITVSNFNCLKKTFSKIFISKLVTECSTTDYLKKNILERRFLFQIFLRFKIIK